MSKITSDTIANALRKRYGGNEYAFMCEVRNATGFPGRVRSADAMAFSLWPSRGLEILGFEIKVSRQDWLKEKENPAKAEEIARHCDRWWMVAPVGLIKKEELPASWGLLELVGEDKLQVTKDAPKLDPQEAKRGFWFSVMKEFVGQVTEETKLQRERKEAEEKGYQRGYSNGQQLADHKLKQAEEMVQKAQADMLSWRQERQEVERILGWSLSRLREYPIRRIMDFITAAKYARTNLDNLTYQARQLSEDLRNLAEGHKLTCSDCLGVDQDCYACHKTAQEKR